MQVDDETILGTTELENIVIKNGKNIVTKRFFITISDLQRKHITVQEDHIIHRYS